MFPRRGDKHLLVRHLRVGVTGFGKRDTVSFFLAHQFLFLRKPENLEACFLTFWKKNFFYVFWFKFSNAFSMTSSKLYFPRKLWTSLVFLDVLVQIDQIICDCFSFPCFYDCFIFIAYLSINILFYLDQLLNIFYMTIFLSNFS